MKILFVLINAVFIGALIAVIVAALFWQEPIEYLRGFIGANIAETIAAVAFLTFLATFIAPLTTIFIVPTAAGFIGAPLAALAGWAGWFAGSLAAFWISRRFGKRLLRRFISEESLMIYERYVPERMSVLTLIFLRMIAPPDVVSYGLGLFSNVPWRVYTITGAIGLLPFAFIGAYLGDAFLSQNWYLLAAFLLLGGAIYLGVLQWLKHGVRR